MHDAFHVFFFRKPFVTRVLHALLCRGAASFGDSRGELLPYRNLPELPQLFLPSSLFRLLDGRAKPCHSCARVRLSSHGHNRPRNWGSRMGT